MNLPSFPHVDLFSAGINALNGVLVARNPSHNRGYAVVGLLDHGLLRRNRRRSNARRAPG